MSAPALFTVKDAIDHLMDYMGGAGKDDALRDAKRSILQAYRKIAVDHRWAYYNQHGRIAIVAPYGTGTIAYDHTGGTYERMVTLTGGTWPTWAASGTLRINSVDYEVAEYKSSTEVTLEIASNPGSDVTAGTTYVLYRDTYPLPTDLIAIHELRGENFVGMQHFSPAEWLSLRRALPASGTPRNFTIMGDPNLYQALALRFYPHPDAAMTIDFVYQRRPRRLSVAEYKTGTVSVTQGAATITGVGTAFTSDMSGAIIRISDDSANEPTSFIGREPFAFERVITNVTSGTALVADAEFESSLSGVKFVISDPIDVEEAVMLNLFLRGCEAELGTIRIMKDKPNAIRLYRDELIQARGSDSRSLQTRVAGGPRRSGRTALHEIPLGPNE